MATRSILLVGLICFFISCSIKPSQDKLKTNVDDIFFIEGICTFDSAASMDSITGIIQCVDIVLRYNYSKFNSSGPVTEEEEFKNAFRGNYHVKFFEKIYMDSKLNRMFIDSVAIKNIQPIGQSNFNLLFPCSSCNKIALLTFRNRSYFYPFYSNNSDTNNYQIKEDTINGYYRKLFYAMTDSFPSGLFFQPLNKSKDNNNLIIFSVNKPDINMLKRLLESVRLIQKL